MDFIRYMRWRPEIGDPSPMGWLTVAAYGLAAITAFAAARRASRAPGLAKGGRTVWWAVGILLALLCINKQLDLQSLFTDIGRVISFKQGWYEQRRDFQKWFVLAVLAGSAGLTLFCVIRFRGFWQRHFLLSCGLIFLLTFIVVRAVSFHHFDVFLKTGIAGVRMNWILELGGIGLVWLAALRDWRNPRRAPKKPWKPAA